MVTAQGSPLHPAGLWVQWLWGRCQPQRGLVLSLLQHHRVCQGKEPAGTRPWPGDWDGQDVPEEGVGCGPAMDRSSSTSGTFHSPSHFFKSTVLAAKPSEASASFTPTSPEPWQ